MGLYIKLVRNILSLLLLLIAAQIFRLWRFFVYILSRIISSVQLDEILDATDNFFVLRSQPNLTTPKVPILIMLELQGNQFLNLKDFQDMILEKVLRARKQPTCSPSFFTRSDQQLIYKRLFQYPKFWMGYTFFAWDKCFSISNHITVSTAFYENSSLCVEEFVQSRIKLPFHQNRSPWEVILLPSLIGQASTTKIFIRMDHVLGDGLSFMRALCEVSSIKNPSIIFRPKSSLKFVSTFRRIFNHLKNEIVLEQIEKQNGSILNFFKIEINETSFVTSTKEFLLENLKYGKKLQNISMTELLTNIFRNNINKLLNEKNIYNIHLARCLFVMLDPKSLTEEGFRNRIYTILPYLTLTEDKFSLSALNKSCIELNVWKQSQVNYFPNIIQNYILLNSPMTAFCITNIVGPTEKVYILSQELNKIRFWVPTSNPLGISVKYFSYNNKFVIHCSGNSYMFGNKENFQKFVQNIEDDLSKL